MPSNIGATANYILNRLSASLRDIERTLALEPGHFGALSHLGVFSIPLEIAGLRPMPGIGR